MFEVAFMFRKRFGLLIVVLAFVGCPKPEVGASPDSEPLEAPGTSPGETSADGGAPGFWTGPGLSRGVVATFHTQSSEAGVEILRQGGNAFDAFAAATFVDYVVSPGVTSPAGPLSAMGFNVRTGERFHLDGNLNEVLSPDGAFDGNETTAGKTFLVPGAVAALAELVKQHGSLPLSKVLEPAIRVARNGFVVDYVYSGTIQGAQATLKKSTYGETTFLQGGKPVAVGTVLKLPALATYLENLAKFGVAHMYQGAWATEAVRVTGERGGKISMQDFAAYRAEFREPRHTQFRGFDVYAPGGRVYAGLWALVGLEVLENTSLSSLGHYGSSADALETMVRTTRVLDMEPWFFDVGTLDNEVAVQTKLAKPNTDKLWGNVKSQLGFTPPPSQGNHSYHIIVADAAGNVITGTNTIESYPFGDGVFVEGVPLNNTGRITAYRTGPGERSINPCSSHLVFRDGHFYGASGAFGTSLIPTELQMLVDMLEYRMPGTEIANALHFGTYPVDFTTGTQDVTSNWLDPRVSKSVVDRLASRGLKFKQDPYGDTGWNIVVTIDEQGEPRGGILGPSYHPSSLMTYP